jgi:hypothetical protein
MKYLAIFLDNLSGIIISVIFFGFIGFTVYAFHESNEQDAQRAIETTKKWNQWLTYRDSNCKLVEKMYGLSETSGKFHQNDNATVYDCDGIKYVIAESVEKAAKFGSLDYDQIPKY